MVGWIYSGALSLKVTDARDEGTGYSTRFCCKHPFWIAQPRGLETIDTVTVCVISRALMGPKWDQGVKRDSTSGEISLFSSTVCYQPETWYCNGKKLQSRVEFLAGWTVRPCKALMMVPKPQTRSGDNDRSRGIDGIDGPPSIIAVSPRPSWPARGER